ncbi:ssDNA exonuclease RecJ, partial [Achromatium sp. WMS1]
QLLADALSKNKHITIIGDYDADGATASALSVLVLKALGGRHVDFLIPDRFTMGYGLSSELVEQAANIGSDLIVTVDSGITSLTGVIKARSLNLSVIITDHHLPGEQLPQAQAIVNPNLYGDQFTAKNTAGVGVAFYLMAVLRRLIKPDLDMAEFLDLVALGTVADLVPLDYNNRILVEHGLRRIRAGLCRPGISALLQTAASRPKRATTRDLAFAIGPRLNAAGRLTDMRLGMECLLCNDLKQALAYAAELNELNQERQAIESQMQEQATQALNDIEFSGDLPYGLCLYNEHWHEGVIGILASRLKERYHRPTIALTLAEDGSVKGSARSIPEIHIRDLLADIVRRYPDILIRYGGHAMAAGLTLHRTQVPLFTKLFATAVQHHLNGELPTAQILTDGCLHHSEITVENAKLLRYAGPWGQRFPAPLFEGRFRVVSQRLVGKIHLKLQLKTEDGRVDVAAIAFRWGESLLDTEWVYVVYQLDLNEYMGQERLQLIIEHIQPL